MQIPSPMGSIALVALVWWCAGVGVPTITARADDCLIAPNSPAPAGSHWYFRTDRAKQRNCWYLHAPDQPPQPAAAISDAPPATHTSAFKKPATASPSALTSTSPGDSAAPPLPPVKPQGAPMSSATTDQPVRQSAQKGSSATSIPDAPAPQASPSSQTGTPGAEPAPATATVRPDSPAVAAVKAQEPAPVSSESVRPTADARASDDAESTARDGGSTANAEKGSSATSIPDAPAPQASPPSQTGTQKAEPAPATATVWPDPAAVAAVKAQEPAPFSSESVRPDARASDDAESTARDGGSTANAAGTTASVTARTSKLEIRM